MEDKIKLKESKCKTPCPECPYIKGAPEGFFGGQDPEIYADAIHRDSVVVCHSRNKYDKDGMAIEPYEPCLGHAMIQIKAIKRPYPNTPLEEVHEKVKDEPRDNILSPWEFRDYHGLPKKVF